MEGLQYDYFGLFPVGSPLVRGRHDIRRAGYDSYFKQLREDKTMTDLEQKCNEYREYKRLAEQAEQMRDSLRDEIITMMQGAPEIVAGACKVMYKDVQSVRLDSKLLKTLHPDVYAECSSKTSYKRFSVV